MCCCKTKAPSPKGCLLFLFPVPFLLENGSGSGSFKYLCRVGHYRVGMDIVIVIVIIITRIEHF